MITVGLLRSDNGTEFKNHDLNQFCGIKGIKRKFSVHRSPQQNGIAEKKNRTLIEATRTMLANSLIPISFWAESVNTACYVKNMVLVTKPHNKTPYELLHGRIPSIGFMRPFGCPVTILNTLDSLGKFDGKVDEGFLVGYFNTDGDASFDEKGPEFDVKKPESEVNVSSSSSAQSKKHNDKTKREAKGKNPVESLTGYRNLSAEFEDFSDDSINEVNAADASQLPDDLDMPELEDITYSNDEYDVGVEADFNNLETSITLICHMEKELLVPNGFSRKKDERGIVVKNKARLVAQGHTHEEGIDYEEVFALVARIEAIRLFLAYASFMGFMVYQMVVKSAFLYETIKEEVYVCQPPGFEDPDYPDKVYKVVKALYGLHQDPRACQDKYVAEILRKFRLTDRKLASTPIDTEKPLLKDPDGKDVDVHTYRSMLGSLMYLTSSRLDIMFAVCVCAHFQVTPKASHLHAVKRIFIYLKGKPHLGLWYPKDSPFDLVAYSDSDYAGASLDKKSTTRGY
uniref:Integrase, catalytic region zinc finger, CCHC-type peptidase aspartic, catalytic n=1 Tax=Tanacetum cinerariifolium TaxID=118510 RepID=A0A699JL70_TANCI|nr:integrase, catalytic region; zinc finger, CCHC-type; peptidase aspartic, catalytic [Tanacetum cinerariifolium]